MTKQTNKNERTCLACGRRPSATLPQYPALCERCLDRAGAPVHPGDRVVCTVDESCGGTVDWLADETIAVIRTADGLDAHIPIQELVIVTKR
jgi:hypothetical protein